MDKLEKIEKKLDIGASNASFYFGFALVIAGISLSFVKDLKESWIPLIAMILGSFIVITSNISLELMKKK